MRTFKSLLISTAFLSVGFIGTNVTNTGLVNTAFAQAASTETVIAPKDVRLTPRQIQSDINLAKDAYSRIHPGYTRYTTEAELNTAWDDILSTATVQNGMSVGEFYIAIQDVLADIRCDHTKAELPKALAKDRNITPVYLPFTWQVIEGRGFIENPNGPVMSRGDEIISIDGRPLQDMMEEVRHLIPVDGFTDFTRDEQMSASLEFKGGPIDHFGAILWDIHPQATLTVKSPNGVVKPVTVDRILYKDWVSLIKGEKTSTDFADAITYNRLGDKAAYLKIDSFVNYRTPVKPDTLYDPIFASIKAEGRDTLILDLRKNGGGSTDAKERLFAHLINKKARLVTDMHVKTLNHKGLEPYISTWDKRLLNPNRLGFKKRSDGRYTIRKLFADETKMIKPDSTAFDGKLIVLTSQSNSSASTALLATLKDSGRATLIGEETGGSAEGTTAGVLFYLTLPESEIRTRIPVIRYSHAVSNFRKGKGVAPHIMAPATKETFIAGEDPAYDAALALITP